VIPLGVRPSRIRDSGDGLTEAERWQIIALSPVRGECAKLLGCADETLAELLSPFGRVRPSTLRRIRARLAEVSLCQTTITTR